MIVYIINKLPKKWLRGYGRAYSHNIGTVIRNLKPKMFRGLSSKIIYLRTHLWVIT